MPPRLAFASVILRIGRGIQVHSSKLQRNRLTSTLTGTLQSRARLWRRRAATVVAAGLACGMAYGVIFGHNGVTAYARKRAEERSLHLQMRDLQQENDRLQGHVERLQKDPSAIEHQAREELHYTRAGEVIYTLPDASETGKPVTAAP